MAPGAVHITPSQSVTTFLQGLDEMQGARFGMLVSRRYSIEAIRRWAISVPDYWSSGSKTLLMEPEPWKVSLRVPTRGPGFVEFGTVAHRIEPRFKKALFFKASGGTPAARVSVVSRSTHYITGRPLKGGPVSSNMVFARGVNHPGVKAVPRLRHVLLDAFDQFGTETMPKLMKAALAGTADAGS
jgi:hypothetical protein